MQKAKRLLARIDRAFEAGQWGEMWDLILRFDEDCEDFAYLLDRYLEDPAVASQLPPDFGR